MNEERKRIALAVATLDGEDVRPLAHTLRDTPAPDSSGEG